MATKQNRIALKGRLDFVNGRFEEVTVAWIDAQGCAVAQQKIRGPFGKPEVEKPNVLISLAGPALTLLRQARSLFGGKMSSVLRRLGRRRPSLRPGGKHQPLRRNGRLRRSHLPRRDGGGTRGAS